MKSFLKLIKTIAIIITGIAAIVALIAGILQMFEEEPEKHHPHGIYEKWFKRPIDAFLSTGALIVFSPILIVTAFLVRIKLGSPVFFTQNRPGKNERIFKLYKFRTMTDARDQDGNLLPDDQRLPAFGKILRSTSIDELPELFNIIKGDMSIVGPRPLLVRYLDRYSKEQHRRHEVRPGLTGYAQAHGRNDLSWENKFAMDLWYIKHVSFLTDVQILFDTIKSVIRREGINSQTATTMEEFKGTPEGVEATWREPE